MNQELCPWVKKNVGDVSNWELNPLNNDPADWIPSGVSVENGIAITLTDVQANTHQFFAHFNALSF